MARHNARRLALATSCAALAACVVNLSFDMDQRGLTLTGDVSQPLAQNVLVDLDKYPDVHSHRSDIESIDLDSADVTITSVNQGMGATLELSLSLRKTLDDPPENDVQLGTLSNFVVMISGTRHIRGNPAIDAFLLERLRDGGTFFLVISGTADRQIDLVLDVDLHASMAYDTGFF